ncbi:serine hydrolase [Flavihumibacter stibioxidans]|uniref:Beta-lactamase n=1 Tax=Flavihumibacter stibioxidans TaxID=1834163 RepID=A0ABR7M6K8_9BACT|nr:serine hydrolase [Flavihumibacter stibioxidans]MBC6490253.1 hypothetical protein [Flavihumibacter stibioxidans]
MRHLILFVTMLVCSLQLSAQADRKMANEIATQINSGIPERLFELFDSTFKTQFPLAEVKNAVPSLQNAFGKFEGVEKLKERNGEYLYKLNGSKSAINMLFRFNTGGLAMLLFTNDDPLFDIKKRHAWFTDNTLQTNTDRVVDSVVKSVLVRSNTAGLSIGVIQNGRQTIYNYGETAWGSGRMPRSASVYEIGSISKTFTGTVVAHFIRTGKINPDDAVNKYLPDSIRPVMWNNEPLLVRHIIGHAAGMPHENMKQDGAPVSDDPDNRMKYFGSKHLLAMLNDWQPFEQPGQKFRYSNYGYSLLGYICERISGQTISQLFQEIIFKPLGMKNTALIGEKPFGDMVPSMIDGKQVKNTPVIAYAPAGGIQSTISDMLRYAAIQLNPGESETGRDVSASHEPSVQTEMKMATGWFYDTNEKGKFFFHSGGTSGFTSRMIFQPVTQTAVVVLSNCRNGDTNEIGDIIFQKLNR